MVTTLIASLVLGPRSPLALELVEHPRKVAVGNQWKSKLVFKNQGGSDIRVVMANGTEYSQTRPPFLTVFIQKLGDKEWTRLKSPPICGNSNPIAPDEFKALSKAKRQEGQVYFHWTAEVVGEVAARPGRYSLKVVYDTTAPIDSWIGGPIPEPAHSQVREAIRPLFNQVPKGVFESKPAEFEVVAPTSVQAR